MRTAQPPSPRRAGYSLPETMVVVLIVGVLAAMDEAAALTAGNRRLELVIAIGFGVGWIFLVLGLVMRTPSTVMTMAFTGTMPLVFASNIMVDPATMPGWLRLFVQLNPVSSMTTAMRGLMGGGLTLSQVGYALLAPALLTLVLAPLTVRLYRRR